MMAVSRRSVSATTRLMVFLGAAALGPVALGCPEDTITPVSVNGEDYVSGGLVSDSLSGELDLCAVVSTEVIASDYEVRLSLELSDGATFAESPSLTVDGALQWSLFTGGLAGDASVTWRAETGDSPFPADQAFTIDIEGIVVIGPDDVEVTLLSRKADDDGPVELNHITGTYIDFSPVVIDENGDGVPDTDDVVTGMVYLQTTSTSQNVSRTHILNSADSNQRFTGTLYASSGEMLGAAGQPLHDNVIPPNGRLILSSEDLEIIFNTPPWVGPAMLEVTSTAGFELMTKLTSPSGLVSNTNCVTQGQVDNIEGLDSPHTSYIRFINVGLDTLENIRGTLYDSNGDVIGDSDRILISSLAPKQQVWLDRGDIYDLVDDNWFGEALLKIAQPAEGLRLLNLNYISNETYFNFSCYEAAQ